MIKEWRDFYSGNDKQLLNNLWIEKARILLAHDRLIGLDLEDATKAVEHLGFSVHLVTIRKGPGYDLVGSAYYQKDITLYVNEGYTTVVRASHGGVW